MNGAVMKNKLAVTFCFLFLISFIICNFLEDGLLDKEIHASMNGETFCLSNEENKNFFRKPLKVKTVYSYNDVGDKIIYKNKKDYIINYQLGLIKRAQNSRIPNYAYHKVNYLENNKFEFVSEPRNPELNVKYQIHVDYIYIPDANETREIQNDSKYLSQKNINKILNDKHINIALIEDSISCGAQTTAQYYFDNQISNTFLDI